MEKQKVNTLTSVNDASKLIREAAGVLPSESRILKYCTGRILAEDVVAAVALPPFNQSAMDGYAVNFTDVHSNGLRVKGTAAAGRATSLVAGKNEAVRIFTGAMMPEGTDTVIKQEDVESKNGSIFFEADSVSQGQNVRLKGAQINNGEIALRKGTRLNPGSIGYLAALGIAEVEVVRSPRVTVVVTGNELKLAGERLHPGEIFESNSSALYSALRQVGVEEIDIRTAIDDPEIIRAEINVALNQSDVVLITGGVSVGDLDYTSRVLNELGVQQIFHNVAQRPGKPLFFGKKDDVLVFGLPGNPASVLSCFYVYVQEALNCLQGNSINEKLRTVRIPLAETYRKRVALTFFLKAKIVDNRVHILPGQESFVLSSFADANCLVVVPTDVTELEAGTEVECILV